MSSQPLYSEYVDEDGIWEGLECGDESMGEEWQPAGGLWPTTGLQSGEVQGIPYASWQSHALPNEPTTMGMLSPSTSLYYSSPDGTLDSGGNAQLGVSQVPAVEHTPQYSESPYSSSYSSPSSVPLHEGLTVDQWTLPAGNQLQQEPQFSPLTTSDDGTNTMQGSQYHQPGHSLAVVTTEPAADAGVDDPAIEKQWILPQEPFTGRHGRDYQPSQPPKPMEVNIPAKDALSPKPLADSLANPLDSGFPLELVECEGEKVTREAKKLTVRLAFIVGNEVLQNERPKQLRDYAARHQSSEAAREALLRDPKRKSSKPIPLMRVTLVELVAEHLSRFMKELAGGGTPLTFRGYPVDYNHLMIVDLFKPTEAAVQPTLMILPKFRYLYGGQTGV